MTSQPTLISLSGRSADCLKIGFGYFLLLFKLFSDGYIDENWSCPFKNGTVKRFAQGVTPYWKSVPSDIRISAGYQRYGYKMKMEHISIKYLTDYSIILKISAEWPKC